MAGKNEDEIILETFMVKRSQNKKYFTPVNFKERWIVLTRRALVYYDSDGEVSIYIFLNLVIYIFYYSFKIAYILCSYVEHCSDIIL